MKSHRTSHGITANTARTDLVKLAAAGLLVSTMRGRRQEFIATRDLEDTFNPTAADYVIHMNPWWHPAAEDQASDRAHRIGQTRPVTIYRLVTKGTIEEQIVRLHRRKPDPDSPNPSKRQHHLTCLP